MSNTHNLEAQFTTAVVRLLNQFNLLELNVGLCIAHLKSPGDPEALYPSLEKLTAERKLKHLHELFVGAQVNMDQESILEFEEWLKIAAQARSIRNRYVHGHWEYLPMRKEKPVGFRAHPWMREKLGQEVKEEMSLADLEAAADEMEGVLDGFMRIRKKHNV